MDKYPNNSFYRYVDQLYLKYKIFHTKKFTLKSIQVFPILLGRVLYDAFIEISLLVLFYVVISRMAQGRDLIVSMFEPDGLYGAARIFWTLGSVLSFSVSM